MTDVAVIGGGIIGLAVAREFMRRHPGVNMTVFEKERELGTHQTGHNSGVVHSGVYYRPQSLKAELCLRGAEMLRKYCQERSLEYEQCGKIIIASNSHETDALAMLYERARKNGVEGVRMLDAHQLRDVEPYAAGVQALHSPRAAIVDFRRVAGALGEDISDQGARVLTSCLVSGLRRSAKGLEVSTASDTWRFDKVIVCAGLHSDRLARLHGEGPDPRIIPFRGRYLRLRPQARHLVRGLIYPVPDLKYPFLGVHLTRHISGDVLVGPNALLALHREGYRLLRAGFRDTADTLAWRGFHRLARHHWRTGARELHLTLSKSAFAREAARYVPSLSERHLESGPAGVRAQAVDRHGTLVDDFRISGNDGLVNVRNAPSPGATSSLAIAEYIADRV